MLQKLAINLIIFTERNIYVGNYHLFDLNSVINAVMQCLLEMTGSGLVEHNCEQK